MTEVLKQQLANTQKELDALKAEYNEFVYIVSHDLKAPLRQIEGFAEILSSKHINDFDDKSTRHLKLISDGSVKANKLLDALAGYSRLNTQATPFTVVNCNALMAEVKSVLLPLIESRKVELITSESLTFPALANTIDVIGDVNQLSQLFYHIIHNAVTYQKPDVLPKITIQVKDKNNCWQFSIKDNGIGIRESLTEKIFKVLRRGVSNKLYPGLGMGLALSSKIVQRHNGRIWIASEKDVGSTLYFTLPKAYKDE